MRAHFSRQTAAHLAPSLSRIIGSAIQARFLAEPLPADLELALSPSDPMRALFAQAEIGAAAIRSALRWRRDWLSYAEGYCEADSRSGGTADIHTAMLARVEAGKRLRAVRDGIGEDGERWLRVMLVEGASYKAAAYHLLPHHTGDHAPKRASATLAFVLLALDARYVALAKNEEMRRIAARKSHAVG